MTLDYKCFSADLPRKGSVTFSSLEENEAVLRSYGVNQEMKQLGKGAFRSALAERRCGEAELICDRYSTALSLYLEPPPNTVGFLFPRTASGRFRASGCELGNDKMLFCPEGSGADIVGPSLIGSDSIVVPEPHYQMLLQRLCPSAEPRGSLAMGGNPQRNLQLRAAITSLVRQPEAAIDSESVSGLLAQLIVALEAVDNAGPAFAPATRGTRVQIARRAREFIEENFRRPVRIDEVCLHTGVGVRTLQRAMRDYYGVSFSEYLLVTRLDALHRALSSADASAVTVSALCFENGLSHLGRASVSFRRHYGESPSQVLRRKPAVWAISRG